MLKVSLPIIEELITPCANSNCRFCFFNYADSISNNYIFHGLKPKEVCHLIKGIDHKVKTWEKDDIILHNGDDLQHFYILVKGTAVGEMMGFDGKILRVEELKATDTIGSAFIYGKNSKIPYDIVAKDFVRALVIKKDVLIKYFMDDERLMKNYFNVVTNWAQNQSKRLKLLGLNTLKGKVAYYFLECAKNQNCNSYKLDKTQTELAEMFGVARPSISRAIKELDESNIIESKGKMITIVNEKALEKLLK